MYITYTNIHTYNIIIVLSIYLFVYVGILKDLILAATHQMDFRHNEVAQEVLAQLLSYQSKMPSLIEQALMSDAEVCGGLELLLS